VNIPILRLANKNIPTVMKRKGISSLDIIRETKRPDTAVSNQRLFPKSDMCNALEYSLFLVKRESMICVTKRVPRTASSLKTISSLSR
jgi:hypothetical protein